MKNSRNLKIYTDGAVKYRPGTFKDIKCRQGYPGWGFVVVKSSDKILYEAWNKVDPLHWDLSLLNIAGELEAVIQALIWAQQNSLKKVQIVHDYIGCAHWVSGYWRAKKLDVKKYVNFVRDCQEHIEINFKHIKGHSGNIWNDHADALAKRGALMHFVEDLKVQ